MILSKWLLAQPQLLICDEPTKGIDVGTKQEFYNILDDLAAKEVLKPTLLLRMRPVVLRSSVTNPRPLRMASFGFLISTCLPPMVTVPALINKLKKQGKSFIYISHRLKELFEIGDRVVVFKDGHYVGQEDRPEPTKPAKPTISPACTVKEQSVTTSLHSPSTRSTSWPRLCGL